MCCTKYLIQGARADFPDFANFPMSEKVKSGVGELEPLRSAPRVGKSPFFWFRAASELQ